MFQSQGSGKNKDLPFPFLFSEFKRTMLFIYSDWTSPGPCRTQAFHPQLDILKKCAPDPHCFFPLTVEGTLLTHRCLHQTNLTLVKIKPVPFLVCISASPSSCSKCLKQFAFSGDVEVATGAADLSAHDETRQQRSHRHLCSPRGLPRRAAFTCNVVAS